MENLRNRSLSLQTHKRFSNAYSLLQKECMEILYVLVLTPRCWRQIILMERWLETWQYFIFIPVRFSMGELCKYNDPNQRKEPLDLKLKAVRITQYIFSSAETPFIQDWCSLRMNIWSNPAALVCTEPYVRNAEPNLLLFSDLRLLVNPKNKYTSLVPTQLA